MFRALLTALALLTPIAAMAEVQSFTERWDGRKVARGDALMRTTILDAHNKARKAYGSLPLYWDAALASAASAYASKLARENRFAHDPQKGVRVRQGENLWMGTRGAFSYAVMAASWIDERKDFKPGRFPDVSRTGDWSVVGHYTQVVWPGTTSVGCAIASNATDDYLVCRYAPAGNVVGVVMR